MRFALISILCAVSLLSGAESQSRFQSLESGERAVHLQPDREANWIALATTYLQFDRAWKAVETLQIFLRSHSGSPRTLSLLATALLLDEDYPAAKEWAARAVSSAPKDAGAVHLLAMAELGLQDTVAAERLLREALTLNPNSVDSNFQLGLLYTKQHEHREEAILLLKRARAAQPGSQGIHTALGSAFLESDQPTQAVRSLEAAVKISPESAESWYLLADAYRRIQQDRKASGSLQHFKQLNTASSDRRAREMRSRAYYAEGVNLLTKADQPAELNKAYDLFDQAVREMPVLDAGYYRLAQLNYLRGDLKAALVRIREALVS